jgi:CSLREA domain-containing protein
MLFSSVTRWLKQSRRSARSRPPRRVRPQLEALEDRKVPAVIAVTTAADDLTPNDGSVSLREAITAINAGNALGDPDITTQNPGTFGSNDTIKFNIPGAGVHTIHLQSALPVIHKPVDLQGYSQPGASPNTLTVGDNAQLMIEIDGTCAGGLDLVIGADHVSVSGFIINRAIYGIDIKGSNGVHVWGDFIGTDATGSAAQGNGIGVSVGLSAKNALIGGPTPAERNVISGNTSYGVFLNSNAASLATGTTIEGNYIGTDKSGLVALGNEVGVDVATAQTTTIGGTAPGEGNLISGNKNDGIDLEGQSGSSALVVGNWIGTDATGTKALGNTGNGVTVNSAGFVTVGEPGAKNVVSGNAHAGIYLIFSAANDVVDSNYVGTTADGTAALGNAGAGIYDNSTPNATIQNNVVAANHTGIQLIKVGATQVMRNFVGTNAAGTAALGNVLDGIDVTASPGLVVGGSGTGNRNVVSGNAGAGIFLASDGVLVLGNFVGTDSTGTGALGNKQYGVHGQGNSNTVDNNLISGNALDGILLDGNGLGNQIQGNKIGIDANGLNAVGNAGSGVDIQQASNTIVGGTAPGAPNTIAFNAHQGVFVQSGNHNHITGNAIFSNGGPGIDLDLSAAPPLGGNDRQPAPVVSTAVLVNNVVTIGGTLTAPNATYDIEYFGNTSVGSAGEGRIYLGTATVMSGPGGQATFSAQFPLPAVGIQSVTATATAANGDTSQFSAATTVAVKGPPLLTSGNNTTFAEGTQGTFTVTATGYPTASLSESGPLPNGVQLIDNGNGTATLAGKPTVAGTFPITITATNGTAPDAKQAFTLTVLTPQQRFVQALYQDDLGRPGDLSNPNDAGYWVNLLTSDALDQAAVAAGVVHSHEAQTRVVTGWYQGYLGRAPLGGEEQYWVFQLAQGQTEEQVLSGILGSDEFFDRAQTLVGSGTPQERFVQGLYQQLLQRTGSAAEVAYWVNQLPPLGRQGVAQGFLGATECRTDVVAGDYTTLLHRAADAAGENYWVFSSLDMASLRIGFEASPEFFANG